MDFIEEKMTVEEVAALAGPSEALASSVRELIDAVIRTQMDGEAMEDARVHVEQATKLLRERELPGSFGMRYGNTLRAWGNSVIGLRNAMAPPLEVTWNDDGTVVGHAKLGAAFEGPAGYVHGGVSALLLDQVCGEAAAAANRPGMTAQLTLRYRKAAKLGPVRVEAEALPEGESHKTKVVGRLISLVGDAEIVCVEAEGLFILPKAVREYMEEMNLETHL
jgi:acyl-coenzyme A thioesterase PaaI-like protein